MATVGACFFASARLDGQLPIGSSGTGLIAGRVLDGATGEPVSGATVMCSASPHRVLSDRQGRFACFDLAEGIYRLWATKPGYARGRGGRRWAGRDVTDLVPRDVDASEQPIKLRNGERRGDLVITLWKQGVISGTIVDEVGEPIIGVQVQAWMNVFIAGRAWWHDVLVSSARTDDRGQYRISGLLAGDYVVVVRAPSITVPATLAPPGPRRQGPWSLELERMFDSLGIHQSQSFPLAGTRTSLTAGEWLLAMTGQPVPPMPRDDRQSMSYPTTFHPSASSAGEATRVDVPPGVERDGVNVQLRPVPVRRVFGVVSGPAGPVPNIDITLTPLRDGGLEEPPSSLAVTDASGRFAFVGVHPGAYVLNALDVPHYDSPSGYVPERDLTSGFSTFSTDVWNDTPTLWASMPITVGDTDLRDVDVTLREASRIEGTVVFSGSASMPSASELQRMFIEIDRADGRPIAMRPFREIQVNARGEFRSVGLPPGRYFIRSPHPPPGWTLESVMYRSRDVSLTALELDAESATGVVITYTDTVSEVSGIVRSSQGVGDRDASVSVFPIERAEWQDFGARPRRIARARADLTGRYVLRGLPAGEYFIVAVDDALMSAWLQPAFFEKLSRVADRVRVVLAAPRTLDLITREIR